MLVSQSLLFMKREGFSFSLPIGPSSFYSNKYIVLNKVYTRFIVRNVYSLHFDMDNRIILSSWPIGTDECFTSKLPYY